MMAKVKHSDADLLILQQTLYGESEANDIDDASAIASVILRRVALPNWPNTVSGVCLQPYAFSCWNAGDKNRDRIMAATGKEKWFRKCGEIAQAALDGKIADLTNGATHYYATYLEPGNAPKWAKGKTPSYVNTYGKYQHKFFNDIDTKPPASASEALDQSRPLSKTRTVKGAQGAAGVGVAATAFGVLAELEPAIPALDWIGRNITTALIIFGVLAFAAAAYVIYARLDDRRSGAR